jgi:hypothetical protein
MENQKKKLRLEDIQVESFSTELLPQKKEVLVLGGATNYCDGTVTLMHDKDCTLGMTFCQFSQACNQ